MIMPRTLQHLVSLGLDIRESIVITVAMITGIIFLSQLDAFSCPAVKQQLAETRARLDNAQLQLAELLTQRDALIEEIRSLKDRHAQEVASVKEEGETSLRSCEERLTKKCQQDVDQREAMQTISLIRYACPYLFHVFVFVFSQK